MGAENQTAHIRDANVYNAHKTDNNKFISACPKVRIHYRKSFKWVFYLITNQRKKQTEFFNSYWDGNKTKRPTVINVSIGTGKNN